MLLAIFISVVAFFLLVGFRKLPQEIKYNYTPIEYDGLTPLETEFLRLVNEHRINIGVNPLIPEKLACEVCEARILRDIHGNVWGSHYDWESLISGAKANFGAHILANNFTTPRGLFNGYMSSEGHRKALEKSDKTHIGTRFYMNRNHTILLRY